MSMTNEEAIRELKDLKEQNENKCYADTLNALDMAIEALEQKPIDKLAMMYEIYMEGVNMSGEYQGCWVRFKDIEKIVDKYMAKREVK